MKQERTKMYLWRVEVLRLSLGVRAYYTVVATDAASAIRVCHENLKNTEIVSVQQVMSIQYIDKELLRRQGDERCLYETIDLKKR